MQRGQMCSAAKRVWTLMKLILVRLHTLWISPAADPAPRKGGEKFFARLSMNGRVCFSNICGQALHSKLKWLYLEKWSERV